jgi:hypothetical protein
VVERVVWLVRVWWYVVVVVLVVALQVVQVVLVGRVGLGGEAGIRRRRLVHRQPRPGILTWKHKESKYGSPPTSHVLTIVSKKGSHEAFMVQNFQNGTCPVVVQAEVPNSSQ